MEKDPRQEWVQSNLCKTANLKKTKNGFQDGFSPNAGSILQYFWPSLSYPLWLRPLFCLFLSGRLRQVLLLLIINFLISQPKHMLWVLERNISMRHCLETSHWDISFEHPKQMFILLDKNRFSLKNCLSWPMMEFPKLSWVFIKILARILDFGTNCIVKQQMFRQACMFTRRSFCCLHTQRINLDQNPD